MSEGSTSQGKWSEGGRASGVYVNIGELNEMTLEM